MPEPEPVLEAEFLTVAEIAAHLRVSKMTVYRLIRLREIRSVRIGHSFRVTKRAVEEYVRGTSRDNKPELTRVSGD